MLRSQNVPRGHEMLDLRRFRGLDTETTGVDLYHGALPFFVTTARLNGSQLYWEWDVDPLTRKPIVPKGDLRDIRSLIADTPGWVLQNPKFDVTALAQLGVDGWPWAITHDTLRASHLVASNAHHDLTSSALVHLGLDLQPYEDAVEKATKIARGMAERKYPKWCIARAGLQGMPSAEEKVWKYDMWLPRAIAREEGYEPDHPWWTVLSEYGNSDSVVLLPLFQRLLEIIEERQLWDIYESQIKVVPVAYKMEKRGITLSKKRADECVDKFSKESVKCGRTCQRIAKQHKYELTLPKNGMNNSLRGFMLDTLKLPIAGYTDKCNPSFDKKAMEVYQATLEEGSVQLDFVNSLLSKRKRDTALSYLEGYKRFWLPFAGVRVLHPNLNPTGTDTLRWSCSSPNEQNISKKEEANLRYCFGPAPRREWWSCDAQNIELRIPAFEAGETEMIRLFEAPDEPPYFGSYHMLIFDTLHPEKFAQYGMECKKVFESTWYQWTKNGNFAVQYGAQEYSGTADLAYHVQGAQRRIQGRFQQIGKLSQRMIDNANKYGYVETMPDQSVDPLRGYPLLCTRSKWGAILPTVPLSYHVQGTAMWWMGKAMVRCQVYLDELNKAAGKEDYYLIMQVHDELVFDFPKGKTYKTNLPKIRQIQRLMRQGGEDLGIPTPVSCTYHADNWSVGISV